MMSSGTTQGATAVASSTALRRVFAAIESKFGGLSSLLDTGSRAEVIVNDEGLIESDDLQRLMAHEATALHVKGFFDREGTSSMILLVCGTFSFIKNHACLAF
jgi:hypothetical protein